MSWPSPLLSGFITNLIRTENYLVQGKINGNDNHLAREG